MKFGASAALRTEEEQRRMCPNGCIEGQIESLENTDKPEVKVILVTDNSFSMSQSQEKLAVGVGSLIDRLKGFTASYHLFTTTQEGDKAVSVKRTGCEVQRGSVTELLTGSACPTGSARTLGSIYSFIESWSLAPSLSTGADFRMTEQASEAEFADLKHRLASAISSPNGGVGTSGSDREQGICTLARSVYEEGANRILNPGDVAVFTVISDEEDFSDLSSCLSGTRTSTDCTAEDTSPVTQTITQVCTRPECASISVAYDVDLAERSAIKETVTYSRLQNPYSSRKIYYRTVAEFSESLGFEYEVARPPVDGVPQPNLLQSGTATLGRLSVCSGVAANAPCATTAQVDAAIARAKALGGTYKANSCRVVSCTQTRAAAAPAPKTVNAASCSALSLVQCEAALGSVAYYEAGSCSAPTDSANCQNVVPTAEVRTLSSREVASARASLVCTSAEISSAQSAVGSGYTYVANSCQVTSSTVTYPATTKSYQITHLSTETADQVNANSYCGSRLYKDNETLSAYASRTNNSRPVSACRIKTIGTVQRSMETVTQVVDRPNGTPLCVSKPKVASSFPKEGGVANISAAFKQRADVLLGSNYFVSAIVHKNASDPNCPILAGQSLGSKYIALANASPGNQGVIASICDSDYGVAFEDVSQWVVKSLANTYVVPNLKQDDEILSVWIVRNGVEVSIAPTDIEIKGNTLKILSADLLQPGDKIHYQVRLAGN
ncbi:MAG: hypothetical protein NDI61_05080 [Bdellovibrionaceae bacterium]|nr:hypothetical protein [Pseudobdellovibrionaceae bacterium]